MDTITIHNKLGVFVPILTAKQCSSLRSLALYGVEQLSHSFPPVNQDEGYLLYLQRGSPVLATHNPLNLQNHYQPPASADLILCETGAT